VPKCGQCGRQALYSVQGAFLCVYCYGKFSEIQQAKINQLMALSNYFQQDADYLVGLADEPPRFQPLTVPSLIRRTSNMTLNNISIQNSTIGAINTGNVKTIDVAIGNLGRQGESEAAEALKAFTEAVIVNLQIQTNTKNEVLEQISFLTEQMTTPKEQRRPATIKSVFDGIGKSVVTVTSLVSLWEKVHPLLNHVLQNT
jgi:hypothetical protein